MSKRLDDFDLFATLFHFTNHIGILASFFKNLQRFVCILAGNDGNHADAHVEGVEHIVLRNLSYLLDFLEDRQYAHAVSFYNSLGSVVECARDIFIETAAGYMNNTLISSISLSIGFTYSLVGVSRVSPRVDPLNSRKMFLGLLSSSNTFLTRENPLE